MFGFIIFIHEFGHFFVAKACGIKVNEFAIGMGPTLFHFQKGETRYALRLLPIGGFCAMEGEDEESDDDRAFNRKPVWKRALVVVMGAIMNVVLGLILMMIILGQQPYFASTTVSRFATGEDGAAVPTQESGLQVGDEIISVNGYAVMCDRDLSFALMTDKDFTVDMTVRRNGETVELPQVRFGTQTAEDGTVSMVLDFYVLPIEKNFGTMITQSFNYTVSTVRMVWASLIGLLTGQYGLNDMAGPVGVAQAIGQAASTGLEVNFAAAVNNILMIMVIFTVNLGVVNLLPIPALDGGKLVFLLIEGIRRKPINPKYEGWISAAGFALVIGLMLVVTFSDVLRLFTGQGLGG